MMRHQRTLGTVLSFATLCIALSGCIANQTSIYRQYSVTDPPETITDSVLIDARQRAILSQPAGRPALICAEPSPDALSAISRAFAAGARANIEAAGGAVTPEGAAQVSLAKSLTEAAAQLGSRNATIQLLRDGLYRQCEAYMNGAITEESYQKMSNRYVNAMVTLLAVERLTPTSATINTTNIEGTGTVRANTGQENGDNPDENPNIRPPAAQAPAGTAGASAPSPTLITRGTQSGTTPEKHVARAVSILVSLFLTKDTVDDCMSTLRETPGTHPQEEAICKAYITSHLEQQQSLADGFAASMTQTESP